MAKTKIITDAEHARRLHRETLTKNFRSALRTLDYEPRHAAGFIQDLLPSDQITLEKIKRAHIFLTAILKAWG